MVTQKQALRVLWNDTCTVTVRQKKRDDTTKLTEFQEVTLWENLPCKLSFHTDTPANGDPVTAAEQTVKLFLSNEVEIPAGSRLTVTRNGKQFLYSNSGEPAVFTHHQEIALTKWRKWA